MSKQNKNPAKNKNKLDPIKLIAEIGSLTVQLEELKDKNRALEKNIKALKEQEKNIIRDANGETLLENFVKQREEYFKKK